MTVRPKTDRERRLLVGEFRAQLVEARKALSAKEVALRELGGARKVTIYSYGSKGREIARILRDRGVDCAIFDNSEASRVRARQDGYRVLEDLGSNQPIIVAAGQHQVEILQALNGKAFNLMEALWAFDLAAAFGPAREFVAATQSRSDDLFEVYGQLDHSSAATFLEVLESRASLDVSRLRRRSPVSTVNLPPLDGLHFASFCDIGTYDGDTLHTIKRAYPSVVRSFTIEPNGFLEDEIAKTVKELGLRNSHFVGAAWNSSSRLSARVSANGMMVIEQSEHGPIAAEPLDTLLGGEVFDLIKMDVEGTEREVIEGGRRAIAAATCVAIACYHLPCDLIDLPDQLAGLLGGELGDTNSRGWRLAFAHYSQVFDDSILYAWRETTQLKH